MDRKGITKLLTEILIRDKLTDRKYYAKEVTLDYGTDRAKRIDVMQFIPAGVIHASDIEKGTFICYEVKSCREDIFSGSGLNFFAEKSYIVTTMETYKKIQEDIREGTLQNYIKENFPESSRYFGIMVPVPAGIDLKDSNAIYNEYENPTGFGGSAADWKLWTAVPCREGHRDRSITELLFCMLRSKHSYTNTPETEDA